jgi:hypothetical protein
MRATPALHAIYLATAALTVVRSRCSTRGLCTELVRATEEIALLREELDLKDSSWIRLAPRRRPHFMPVQRMRILQLKAARGWSNEQAAKAISRARNRRMPLSGPISLYI